MGISRLDAGCPPVPGLKKASFDFNPADTGYYRLQFLKGNGSMITQTVRVQ
jgi:hypothetical protein